MQAKTLFTVLLLFAVIITKAQNAKIGQFYDHLPYSSATVIAKSNDKIFVGAGQAMFTYDIADGSIETLSKVNALSDLGITSLAYSDALGKLIIGYESGNIDILQNNRIINIPDIVRTSIQGVKSVNSILIDGNLAYLSAGFGVVKLDIQRNEIKETFFIGDDATSVFVNEIALFNDTIYAATKQGMYAAKLTGTNLVDFQNWTQLQSLPIGNYNTICQSENMLITNFNTSVYNQDTIWSLSNNKWSKTSFPEYFNGELNKIFFQNGKWLFAYAFGARFVEPDLSSSYSMPGYGNGFKTSEVGGIIIESNNKYWVADKNYGLLLQEFGTYNQFLPAGPASFQAWAMDYKNDELWVASGSLTPGRANNFQRNGIYRYKNREWSSFNGGGYDSIFDITSIAINPFTPGEVYAGSWGKGLAKTQDGVLMQVFDGSNSTITANSVFEYYTVGDVTFDANGTLWATVSGLPNANVTFPIVSYDGTTWRGYDMNNQLVTQTAATELLIDDFNNKWFVSDGNGVFVFNDNNTPDEDNDDKIALITTGESKGNLPTKQVNAIAMDNDAKLWIGTDEGLIVVNSTFSPFDNQLTADRIIIEQEGAFEFLLESVIINTIKIDGANRKWIGTQSNGVYLITADGQETIHQFTADNSPLLSNTIFDIEIFGSTGEVFFATDKGLMSYIGDATDPDAYDGPTYAYPNPVRPDYEGEIGIKGLVPNAEVKITDITGNVIYETFSKGTTATWDGNSLNGKRAQTGVYIVFSVADDGEEKEVAKILFIN